MLSLQYMIFSQCEQNASLCLLENLAFFAKMEIILIEKCPTWGVSVSNHLKSTTYIWYRNVIYDMGRRLFQLFFFILDKCLIVIYEFDYIDERYKSGGRQ